MTTEEAARILGVSPKAPYNEAKDAYRRQPVRLGSEQGGRVEVLDGLKEGQSVVAEGSLLLQQLLAGKA